MKTIYSKLRRPQLKSLINKRRGALKKKRNILLHSVERAPSSNSHRTLKAGIQKDRGALPKNAINILLHLP